MHRSKSAAVRVEGQSSIARSCITPPNGSGRCRHSRPRAKLAVNTNTLTGSFSSRQTKKTLSTYQHIINGPTQVDAGTSVSPRERKAALFPGIVQMLLCCRVSVVGEFFLLFMRIRVHVGEYPVNFQLCQIVSLNQRLWKHTRQTCECSRRVYF